MRRPLALVAWLLAVPAGAVHLESVLVGNPGNAPDSANNCLTIDPDCGSVPDQYVISKYEVTNAQYAEFLNAVAAADPNGLYNTEMNGDANGGITRSGGRRQLQLRGEERPGEPPCRVRLVVRHAPLRELAAQRAADGRAGDRDDRGRRLHVHAGRDDA